MLDPIASLEDMRRHWGWILAFGVISIILGMIAVGNSVFFTFVSVVFLGSLLLVAGIFQGIDAIRHREHGHVVLHVAESLLAIAAGILLLSRPGEGALIVTLLMAMYFTLIGIFRIISAFALRLPHWGWMVFNGVVTLALGVIVWMGWPVSGLWVLGLFLGIQLIFAGWSEVMLAIGLHHEPFHPLPV
jgi:uncharacterized membrane protein HdeD (DUF308 family)